MYIYTHINVFIPIVSALYPHDISNNSCHEQKNINQNPTTLD